MYYVTTVTSGSYIVDDAFGNKHVGIVKSITPPSSDAYHTIVVTLDNLTQAMPASNDYFFFVKDNKANKSGLLGYYAEVLIRSNQNNSATELYSVGSEVFESSK